MNEDAEKRIAAQIAKAMAMICVRSNHLEDFHAGRVPVSRVCDESDVFVVGAEGNRIPWTEVSRIDDDEMRDIVNRLYTFHLCADDPALQAEVARWISIANNWDDPDIDPGMIGPDVPVD